MSADKVKCTLGVRLQSCARTRVSEGQGDAEKKTYLSLMVGLPRDHTCSPLQGMHPLPRHVEDIPSVRQHEHVTPQFGIEDPRQGQSMADVTSVSVEHHDHRACRGILHTCEH